MSRGLHQIVMGFRAVLPSTRAWAVPPVAVPVRPIWLQIQVQAATPNIQDYARAHRAGKSRRRGRHASARWAIDQLRHLHGGWEPRVYLSDIRQGNVSYMAGTQAPVNWFSMPLPVALPLLRPLTGTQFEIANRDTRRVNVMLVLGCHVA